MKIISVLGARPQFVKAAPVCRVLRERHQEILVHTGQHYDDEMSKVFFDELQIPRPDINLGIGSGSHAQQTAGMLTGLERVLTEHRPDLVMVYGDTNSTLAGALAAVKLNLRVAHVEAGLRSYNRGMPEEINRVLSDRMSDLLFCPTATAVSNLAREGIARGVHLIGDVMYDAILQFESLAASRSRILSELGLKPADYLLLTLHRAQNTDDKERLQSILEALIASQLPIIFPVHPRTKKCIQLHGLESLIDRAGNIRQVKPVSYLNMLMLEKHAAKILTDSGGVQKEAYFLKVPCITLREETEWVETVQDGWNCLVGADAVKITKAILTFNPTGAQHPHYGDGTASRKLVEILDM